MREVIVQNLITFCLKLDCAAKQNKHLLIILD